MFRLPATTTFPTFLNRRTIYTAVGAKNTAVSRFGFHNRSTMGALVEELAGIRRHDLFFAETTFRTSYHRLKFNINCHFAGYFKSMNIHFRLVKVDNPAKMSFRFLY
jgi:hypothetical protein